jgi:hypothetical protein
MIQIVRRSRSTADIQPQLQPALLRLSAMISCSISLKTATKFASFLAHACVYIGRDFSDPPAFYSVDTAVSFVSQTGPTCESS